jgi:FKBP-type peptidyl-prolyl cis-trans isomerase FkpA
MKKTLLAFIFPALLIAMVSCNGCSEGKRTTEEVDYNKIQQDLIEDRKKDHEKETKRIKKFIKENNWPMTETKTGLQYWIYETGTGELARLNEFAMISYNITLTDGTLCYKADDGHPKEFKIGEDNVESGLHELVQLMRPGDKAKCVMPSHLAFGFTGDNDKIPPASTVVYDIHLIRVHQ